MSPQEESTESSRLAPPELLRRRLAESGPPMASRFPGPPGASGLPGPPGASEFPGPPTPARSMAPSLAYGRHRGPSRPHSRVAAVAIALFRDRNDNWTVPLTLRPLTLKHHGGQICLPGGQVEPGEAIGAAAMREFEEELGRRPEILGHVGELSTQYVYASDNVVHPVVFEIQAPDGPWHPDPVEVAEVIQLPLRALGRSGDRVESICSRPVLREDEEKGRFRFRMSAWRYRGHEIWGATALILEELAQLLHPIE